MVNRHEAVRSRFEEIDGAPVCAINPVDSIKLNEIDIRDISDGGKEEEALRLISGEARRSFDLGNGSLFEPSLYVLDEDDHILLTRFHHTVFDGWSRGVFHREMAALYRSFKNGLSPEVPALPVQYGDFARWQREQLHGETLEKLLEYWMKQLREVPNVLEIPTDNSRPPVQTDNGDMQSVMYPAPLIKSLSGFSRKEKVTLFMTLLAAYEVLMYRYSGQELFAVGFPISGRTRREIENNIGFFVKTLVQRADLQGNPTFRELVKRVRESSLGAFENQDLPFDRLVEELQPERNLSYGPVFQVIFNHLNPPRTPLILDGLDVNFIQLDLKRTQTDLMFATLMEPEGLRCFAEYNTDLFETSTILRMLGHYQRLLEGIAENPDRRISELPLIPDREYQQLVEWSGVSADYPRYKCIHHLFEAQVARKPESIAVRFEDDALTYRELNTRVNQLAHRLMELGCAPGTLVGVCLDRSFDLIVSLLAVMKSGGAYVPLDPDYPTERLKFLAADSGVKLLLTERKLEHDLSQAEVELLYIDDEREKLGNYSAENPSVSVGTEDPICALYTSGSTGKPKGVILRHRSVINTLLSVNSLLSIGEDDIMLAISTVSFDASVAEFFTPLITGGQLIIAKSGVIRESELLLKQVENSNPTLMFATPVSWKVLIEAGWKGSKQLKIIIGGEALTRDLAKQLTAMGKSLLNVYGPTEAAIYSVVHQVTPSENRIRIGRPLPNVSVYVLDGHKNRLPIGVPGELYLGGAGVAEGYINRPELTAEKFLPDPFSEIPGAKIYRTGDLVKYLSDGTLVWLARLDNQVKLRGQRIELGEIEAVLNQCQSVKKAVVIVREDRPGDQRLVAYIIPSGGDKIDPKKLRDYLVKLLPNYMVPSIFMELSSFPLTSSKKVDRKALPAPDKSLDGHTEEYMAPRNDLERKLTEIWAKVLDVERVGVKDNFFQLGGHSLLALRLISRIKELTGQTIPLATLFKAQTVESMADMLRRGGQSAVSGSLVTIQKGGGRPPLFCVHPVGGNVIRYQKLAYELGPDQPFYGLQAKGVDGKSEPLTNVEDIAAHYIEAIRNFKPEGPYMVGGLSNGGVIAFEMARQLEKMGEKVALLILFDTYGPGYIKKRPFKGKVPRPILKILKRIRLHWVNLATIERREWPRYFIRKYKTGKWRFENEIPSAMRKVRKVTRKAVEAYQYKPYNGKLTMFRASWQPKTSTLDPYLGWGKLAKGGVEAFEVTGSHALIIEEPHVKILAKKLREYIDESSGKLAEAEV